MNGSFQKKFWGTFNKTPAQYFKADVNYTRIIFPSGKELVSAYTLKYFEERMPQQSYYRINRSLMVNIELIDKIIKKNGNYFINLKSGERIKIPRRSVPELLSNEHLKVLNQNEINQ